MDYGYEDIINEREDDATKDHGYGEIVDMEDDVTEDHGYGAIIDEMEDE